MYKSGAKDVPCAEPKCNESVIQIEFSKLEKIIACLFEEMTRIETKFSSVLRQENSPCREEAKDVESGASPLAYIMKENNKNLSILLDRLKELYRRGDV